MARMPPPQKPKRVGGVMVSSRPRAAEALGNPCAISARSWSDAETSIGSSAWGAAALRGSLVRPTFVLIHASRCTKSDRPTRCRASSAGSSFDASPRPPETAGPIAPKHAGRVPGGTTKSMTAKPAGRFSVDAAQAWGPIGFARENVPMNYCGKSARLSPLLAPCGRRSIAFSVDIRKQKRTSGDRRRYVAGKVGRGLVPNADRCSAKGMTGFALSSAGSKPGGETRRPGKRRESPGHIGRGVRSKVSRMTEGSPLILSTKGIAGGASSAAVKQCQGTGR